MKKLLSLLFLVTICSSLLAQVTRVKGTVRDAKTREALSYVNLHLSGTNNGKNTDDTGKFDFSTTNPKCKELVVHYLGYKVQKLKVIPGKVNKYKILLEPNVTELEEFVVTAKRVKYRKKNNPAVIFVRKVIKNREKNNPHKKHTYFNYEAYKKTSIAFNDFTEKDLEKGIFKRFKFMKDYIEENDFTKKSILTVSIREELSDYFYQAHPKVEKRVIRGRRNEGLDEIFSQDGMQQFLGEVFKEVNVFQNDISLFLSRFVSPISSIAPSYYKFFIKDTVVIEGMKCMNLEFTPFNRESFGFDGNMYVALDSTFYVKRISMWVPKNINLNFVKRMSIEQTFARAPDGSRLKTKDDIKVLFKLLPKTDGLYARRVITYKNHSFKPPTNLKLLKMSAPVIEDRMAELMSEDFWKRHRHEPIEKNESRVKALMTQLRSNPLYYYSEKVLKVLVSGYIPNKEKGAVFDFGPMNTSITGNTMEGLRLRAGGMTTAFLNPHWFASGFLAYGFKDEKLKYESALEYSFDEKKEHPNEFPIHSLKGSYSYDMNHLGQQYSFTNKDNFVLALKRKEDVMNTYLRKAELKYHREHYSGFSYSAALRHSIESATSFVPFNKFVNGRPTSVPDYRMATMKVKLRYAPNEKFYQFKTQRIPITLDAPVFTLSHTVAQKGFLGSDYSYNYTQFGFAKQFWLSMFGFLKVNLDAGKIWDRVPYPLLKMPNANLSYTIQPGSFALMNPLEFITDQYVSLDLGYHGNGVLFNRLPFIKRLKWREVLSFRGMYGTLSKSNFPSATGHNEGLFELPARTYTFGNEPYMEAGVGIENIFKVVRLDYVWRLNYLGHPGVSKGGVRIMMNFSF